MQKTLIIILLSLSVSLAGDNRNDVVQIGDFDYQGKVIRNAEARFITANKVQISQFIIPWDQLSPTIQFKLKPLRERLGPQLAATEEAISKGLVSVAGKVVRVESGGCVVHCEKTRPPSDPLTKNGGKLSAPPAIIPEASGTIFVRGIQGLADGESVNVKALKTEEIV